jgi:Subtilisin inhibitor-like
MRPLLVLACALALVVPAAAAAPGTSLTITYIADVDRPADRVRWTVQCNPAQGTHPRRAAVCSELSQLGWQVFRPVPQDKACTQIYGGPQVAIVSGRVNGHTVWARLSRADGCQISRWGRVRSLLPPGGAR